MWDYFVFLSIQHVRLFCFVIDSACDVILFHYRFSMWEEKINWSELEIHGEITTNGRAPGVTGLFLSNPVNSLYCTQIWNHSNQSHQILNSILKSVFISILCKSYITLIVTVVQTFTKAVKVKEWQI